MLDSITICACMSVSASVFLFVLLKLLRPLLMTKRLLHQPLAAQYWNLISRSLQSLGNLITHTKDFQSVCVCCKSDWVNLRVQVTVTWCLVKFAGLVFWLKFEYIYIFFLSLSQLLWLAVRLFSSYTSHSSNGSFLVASSQVCFSSKWRSICLDDDLDDAVILLGSNWLVLL